MKMGGHLFCYSLQSFTSLKLQECSPEVILYKFIKQLVSDSEVKDIYVSDYGNEDIDNLVDHFKLALDTSGLDVSLISHEWTRLKQHMQTRLVSFFIICVI